MKTAVIYHSKYGQTQKIAARLAERLVAANHEVEVFDINSIGSKFSVERFDVVIVGGPIYATKHSKLLVSFVKQNRTTLAQKTSAFFSVSLSAAGNEKHRADALRCLNQFLKETGWRPQLHTIFAGGVPYRKYNWFIRWVMKRMVSSAGGDTDTSRNYEYTDWEAVDRFAKQLVSRASESLNKAGETAHDSILSS